MGDNSIVTKNELIALRRKKVRHRRAFMLLILLVAILITLALKLPYFNITDIKVTNNSNLTSEAIIRASGIFKGNNIFYVNFRKSKEHILSNPYVLKADIKRKFPSTVTIDVKERNAAFYLQEDKKIFIVDKDGIVLEERDNILGMKLTKLSGVDTSKIKIGKILSVDDVRKIDIIKNVTELLSVDKSGLEMSMLDISDIVSLKAYYGNMCVKLGTGENLKDKLNKAISIMSSNKNLSSSKGYIDVGFEGTPVINIEK